MAWLEQHPASGRYKLVFRYGGRKFKKCLKTTDEEKANGVAVRVRDNLDLMERGILTLPPGGDLATFLISDGRLAEKPSLPKLMPLGEVVAGYVKTHSNGVLEANSLSTIGTHMKHIKKTLGEKFTLARSRFSTRKFSAGPMLISPRPGSGRPSALVKFRMHRENAGS